MTNELWNMSVKYKALVVDDEVENVELITQLLGDRFQVHGAQDGEAGIDSALRHAPDVVLLDVGMPKLDGIAVCDRLRKHEATKHIPIIMLTAANDSDTIVKSFECGADDYISKPYRAKELVSRVLSKIRRIEESKASSAEIKCGNLTLFPEQLSVKIAGNDVHLSLLEFNLLKYLVENKDKILSREKILQAVWKEHAVSDRTVDTHMVSLRKHLKEFDHALNTIYGAGYILKKA